jgi:hypothetical protein
MVRCRILCLLLPALVGACGTPAPPTSRRVVAHEAVAQAAGSLLVVDVCLNHSPLGVDDYFVVSNSRQGADALLGATAQFFEATDVQIRTRLIPFVCGALHDSDNAPKRVADVIDGAVRVQPQPLWVAPEVAADAEYVHALQLLSSHVFQRSLADVAGKSSAPVGNVSEETSLQLQGAAALVARRSGRSSLIYIGATGHSLSSGKAAALNVARVAAGIALSVAVGPVFTAGGTSYGVVFVPGGPVDKRQVVAGLFDLQQAKLLRSNVIHGGGDPMKIEVLASRTSVQLLLRDVAFSTAGD